MSPCMRSDAHIATVLTGRLARCRGLINGTTAVLSYGITKLDVLG